MNIEDTLKEFREKFGDFYDANGYSKDNSEQNHYDNLKSFLRSSLEKTWDAAYKAGKNEPPTLTATEVMMAVNAEESNKRLREEFKKAAYQEGWDAAIREENTAWIKGARCDICGKEKIPAQTWSTCDDCL